MGAVLTNDKDIYDQLISLRYLGFDTKGEICFYPSLNNKIDTLLASMMLTSFKYFDENFNTRIKISNYYSDNLSDYVVCPILNNDKDVHCTFFDYTIIAEDRDNLKHFLEGKEGLKSLKIINAIYKSSKKSNRIFLKQNLNTHLG